MEACNKIMMLVIFIFLGAASLCHSKAFPEGSRGKRLHDHGQYTDQSYLQTYEDYWKQRGFYYPEVDGQPIYIPAINQPEKIMNEYIDHYYRNKPTEVPVLQSANPYNYHYESTTDLSGILNNFGEANDNHYGNYHMIPETKHDRTKYQNFDVNPEKDNLPEYYTPEIVAKVKIDDYESKVQKGQTLKNMDEKYEEPVTYKLYEPAQAEKQKGKHVTPNLNDYDLPTIKETLKHIKPKSTLSPSKKAKGKRKKQYHAQKYGTKELAMPSEAIDQVLDFKSVDSSEEFKIKTEEPEYSIDKPVDSATKKSEKKEILKTKDTASKTESKEYEDQYVMEKDDDLYYDTKETAETNEYDPTVKTKEKVMPEPKEPAKIKEKVVVKPEPKEPPVKIQEKVVVKKPDPKEPSVKIKEKVVVKKPEPKEPPLKTKEKVVEKEPEIKDKEVVKEKTKEVKPESEEFPVKKDDIKIEYVDDDNLKNMNENSELSVDLEMPVNESTDFEKRSLKSSDSLEAENASEMLLENESEDDHQNRSTDLLDQELEENHPVTENVKNLDESQLKSKINSKNENSGQKSENLPKFLPDDALQKLSSLNSNIWSLVFNPNAQALNLKKCVTRSNETGYCTYVQHCEVSNLVTSLEQLLNNACVIDEIFIGVCCPEFPVETVKVHWDQPPSGSDTRIEDEFGHSAEDCGIRSNEASKLQSWPWKAPLVSMSNGKIFCGGVLIHEEYVLTAAHCTTKIPRNQILVRLGQFDDSTGDDFAVVEIKRHAQYNPRTLHNDIALLKLGRIIMLGDHTGIICLPEDVEDAENDHVGEKATLLGWRGMFGTKSKDPESLKIMSNEECAKKLGVKVPDSLLCTDARNEDERTCNADSGAPLVIEDDGKYEVIGILSWNRNDCDQRFPSTFSRISNYVGWIQKHLN